MKSPLFTYEHKNENEFKEHFCAYRSIFYCAILINTEFLSKMKYPLNSVLIVNSGDSSSNKIKVKLFVLQQIAVIFAAENQNKLLHLGIML